MRNAVRKLSRAEKIKNLRDILNRKKTVSDLLEHKTYLWQIDDNSFYYSSQLMNQNNDQPLLLTEEQFNEFVNQRKNAKHLVFKPCSGCDPIKERP